MILGYIVRLKVKEIEIWNLSKVILSNFIHGFGCNFNSAKKKQLNEIIIISNREVLNCHGAHSKIFFKFQAFPGHSSTFSVDFPGQSS